MTSGVAADEYDELWLGEYSLFDIDGNGTDELIILSGGSMASMSRMVFTCSGGKVEFLGVFGSYGGLYGSRSGGVAVESLHGGSGMNFYAGILGGRLTSSTGSEYNYEAAGWESEFESDEWTLLDSYSVHDTSPLT